ncbi:MAG TPA: outer membrane lipoprotein carrier protein LolA [Chitinophagaceae bacterium]|jgi:outer membrane lipoprotein carrier protein|nr:outer membrane lipoprotein carrier protein LolA [Chitinophagaceae bacterium]
MMKIFLIGSLLVGFAMMINAQTGVTNDPAAKKILDGVSAKFKTYKAVQLAFTLKVEDGKGKVQGSQKGTVYMKGNKYRVSMAGKENKEIFSDGSTMWTYDKASNEVTITKFDPTAKTITPQSLLTNFYDKDFLYKLNGEQKDGARTLQEIEMTPLDKGKTFHKVYVYVDKAKQGIYNTKVLDKNGNKYTYTVNSLNGNAPVSDLLFVFDKSKYPGVEEVDLR